MLSQSEALQKADSRKALAKLLNVSPSFLAMVLYKTPSSLKYTTFDLHKKSGGIRTIKAPIPQLKILQLRLSHLLYQYLEEIDKKNGLRPISFGFRSGRSIIDNAARHKRQRWVLNLDLEDFFPSFNFGRVRGFFLHDKEFSLHPEVATTIAQIACDGVALPQGSPCSPVISELIAQILDRRLIRLAKKYKVTYTRYADDITFSTSQREFPSGLAYADVNDVTKWHLSVDLTRRIVTAGFTVNAQKTRMAFRDSRQTVTGLVVNDKVNVPSNYYRRVRAMCDHLFQTGTYYKATIQSNNEGEQEQPQRISALEPLEGMLSYIYETTQKEERRNPTDQRKYPRAIRKLFRRFLFYKNCIALDKPLIITEGKTDIVYLKAAIERCKQFHPDLGKYEKEKFKYVMRFFKTTGVVSDVMQLGGGTRTLVSVILDYVWNTKPSTKSYKPFAHMPMLHPVIIILDNDGGLRDLRDIIRTNFRVEISTKTTSNFYHLTGNLYVVKTPEFSLKGTCIEDCFPKTLLGYKLNGKKLNMTNNFNKETDYSKEIFARYVVKPNVHEIDFSRFEPLLERINSVIQHHRSNVDSVS